MPGIDRSGHGARSRPHFHPRHFSQPGEEQKILWTYQKRLNSEPFHATFPISVLKRGTGWRKCMQRGMKGAWTSPITIPFPSQGNELVLNMGRLRRCDTPISNVRLCKEWAWETRAVATSSADDEAEYVRERNVSEFRYLFAPCQVGWSAKFALLLRE